MITKSSANEIWNSAMVFLEERKKYLSKSILLIAIAAIFFSPNFMTDNMKILIPGNTVALLTFLWGSGRLLRYGDIIGEDQFIIFNLMTQNELSNIVTGENINSKRCLVATNTSNFYVCLYSEDSVDREIEEYSTTDYTMLNDKEGFSIVHKKTGAAVTFTVNDFYRKLNKKFNTHFAKILYMKDRSFVTPMTIFRKR